MLFGAAIVVPVQKEKSMSGHSALRGPDGGGDTISRLVARRGQIVARRGLRLRIPSFGYLQAVLVEQPVRSVSPRAEDKSKRFAARAADGRVEAVEAFLLNRKRANRQNSALLTYSGFHPNIDHWRTLAKNTGAPVSPPGS